MAFSLLCERSASGAMRRTQRRVQESIRLGVYNLTGRGRGTEVEKEVTGEYTSHEPKQAERQRRCKMNRVKEFLLVGFVVVLSITLFISHVDMAGAKEKGVFVIGGVGTVLNLDPSFSSVGYFTMMYRNLFQGLLRYKFNSSELEGDLAKSWSMSRDGLVYTFKLRDNVKWHKGFGTVTAQDVKFSFDRIMDPKTRSGFIGDIQPIKEAKVVDNLTVEIHLKDRDPTFLHRCARPKPVAIVCKSAVEKYGSDFARNPIGSGPFVFQSMSREEIVLTANKEYYEGPPKIEKVIYKAIAGMDTLVMSLITGEIDYIWSLAPEESFLNRIESAGCKITNVDYGAFWMILMNRKVEPLGDLRVRRAIAHAIDKDELIRHVFVPGTMDKLDSLVPKGYFGHTEEGLRRYNFDPKRARELLAEAGYRSGFDITLDTYNNSLYLRPATAVQNQLAKVGIRVKLDVSDQTSWIKKLTGGTASLSLFLPSRLLDADSPLTSYFHTAGFTPGFNLARYNKLDKEIDEARRELDKNKRLKLYHDIQKKLMEDLPAIPIANYKHSCAHRPSVSGLPGKDPMWGIDLYAVQVKE